MQIQQLLNQISNKNAPENVQGWERAASAVTGLLMVKKGLRARGLGSLVLLATGGMAVMRAVNGRCEIKRRLTESQHGGSQGSSSANKERYSHMPMDSEPHSPDFKSQGSSLPDSTQMGNEAAAARGATTAGGTGASTSAGSASSSNTAGGATGSGTASTLGSSGTAGGVGSSSSLGNPTPAGTSGSAGSAGSATSSTSSNKPGSTGKQ